MSILAPVITLVLWTLVMCAWLYATRIPAARRLNIPNDRYRPQAELLNMLPAEVRWKADNYNHLMEQPTLFYAVALTLAVMHAGDGTNTVLAWLYVYVRVLHSLVQALFNVIVVRFAVFMAGTLILLVLTIRAALVVF
jgi:hypothetical protein